MASKPWWRSLFSKKIPADEHHGPAPVRDVSAPSEVPDPPLEEKEALDASKKAPDYSLRVTKRLKRALEVERGRARELRGGLEFYADRASWRKRIDGSIPAEADRGRRARELLR